jgi:hypothetical protein
MLLVALVYVCFFGRPKVQKKSNSKFNEMLFKLLMKK